MAAKKLIIIDGVTYTLIKEIPISRRDNEVITKFKVTFTEGKETKYALVTRVYKDNKYTWSLSTVYENKTDWEKF